MPSNGVSDKRQKVGLGYIQQRGDKWRTDFRKKGVPTDLQRKTFPSERKAKEFALWLTDQLKQGSGSVWSYFQASELIEAKSRVEDWKARKLSARANRGISIERPSLGNLVELGLRAWEQRDRTIHKVSFREAYEEWLAVRPTAKGKKKGAGSISKSRFNQEKRFVERFTRKFGNYRLSYFFWTEGDLNVGQRSQQPKKELEKFIENLKTKNCKTYHANSLHTFSASLTQYFDFILERYELRETNPAEGLSSRFKKEQAAAASTMPPKEVTKLFKTLKETKDLHDLIPYFALLFFSGQRPLIFADPNDKRRRFSYENFQGWENKSSVSKGVEFRIPAFIEHDGKKFRAAKKDSDTVGDLIESGVLWMNFYWLEIKRLSALPKNGEVYYSRRKVRKLWNILGINSNRDIARHTFCTAIHKVDPDHRDYWFDHLGHAPETFHRFYRNPSLTLKEAENFLFLIRPNLI